MKYRSSNEIRDLFLNYFASKGHMIEPGASLVPVNDPTLLWINSGVAALKKYFDGSIKPKNNRITNAQKSIRTNDIENVGKTARHHTFFEMLGNFSIGDYFKEDAIKYAWEFLTSEDYIGMEKEKMYVSVHPTDTEAYRIWTEVIGLDPKRILKSEENYWQIGEGPCGPNSEIYYDRGLEFDPQGLGEKLFFEELENDRYIEIWNVVFSQYDGKEGVDRKDYKELPQKNIDTGMGFERLVSVVQKGETNFDTDVFMPVIQATEKLSKYPYVGEYKMAYRVIADHIRTVSFALADGALFSNEGRGYVLRRILRRAVRYGIKLGIEKAFMYELVKTVAEMMSPFYGYLNEKVEYVSRLVLAEEQRFHKTLNAGEQLLMSQLDKVVGATLSGEVIFKLYDTYGFPYELTQEIALEKGIACDEVGFKQEMEKQRERARSAMGKVESMGTQSVDLMNFKLASQFVGYQESNVKAKVIGLFKNGVQVDELFDQGEVILDVTSFYAESGGQIADAGQLVFKDGLAVVKDVQKAPHKQHLHTVELVYGELKLGIEVSGEVDLKKRNQIIKNHSAAHLLQAALQGIVGSHIHQAGSYVSDEYVRFDFTHFEKLSEESLKAIERKINQDISDSIQVQTQLMDLEAAKASGAMALFSEKYEDKVRVVSMGSVSKELCGGIHVLNTAEIGSFKLISEESIGSGIRRIIGKTGFAAYEENLALQAQLESIATLYKANSSVGIEHRVSQSLKENNLLKQESVRLSQKIAHAQSQSLLSKLFEKNGIQCLVEQVEGDANQLKLMVETLKNLAPEAFILLGAKDQDKLSFVAYASSQAIAQGLKAGDVVKAVANYTGGNGGGRPDFAQSGGKDIHKLEEALNLYR